MTNKDRQLIAHRFILIYRKIHLPFGPTISSCDHNIHLYTDSLFDIVYDQMCSGLYNFDYSSISLIKSQFCIEIHAAKSRNDLHEFFIWHDIERYLAYC